MPPRASDTPLPPFNPPAGEAWVRLKYFSYHPCLYTRLIDDVSRTAKKGDLVRVYDKDGQPFGTGLWNPRAKVPLRVLAHGPEAQDEAWLTEQVLAAARFRTENLGLDGTTDAYRVIHSDGDRLSGLIIDRYADVLRVEVHSYGMWTRLPAWLPLLHEVLGTSKHIVSVDPDIAQIEGIPAGIGLGLGVANSAVRSVRIREHGVRYAVNFESGHKTGFFCDQRENRRYLANFTAGKDVLDLCCYTGGFSLAAKVLGKAADVTGVDLDEAAIEQAQQNANLNQVRLSLVHTDAFQYARQMEENQRKWDVVVLDPPKLIHSREEDDLGYRKYEDLNRLALRLVKPGGVFLTCSCSGLLSAQDFGNMVTKAAHREGKKLQFFQQTGPDPDHPVFSNCPESAYLKTIWARVF